MDISVIASKSLKMDSLSYFSFLPGLHDWCYNVVVCPILSGIVHIKEPLLLIGKSGLWGGSWFPLTMRVVLNRMSDAI